MDYYQLSVADLFLISSSMYKEEWAAWRETEPAVWSPCTRLCPTSWNLRWNTPTNQVGSVITEKCVLILFQWFFSLRIDWVLIEVGFNESFQSVRGWVEPHSFGSCQPKKNKDVQSDCSVASWGKLIDHSPHCKTWKSAQFEWVINNSEQLECFYLSHLEGIYTIKATCSAIEKRKISEIKLNKLFFE